MHGNITVVGRDVDELLKNLYNAANGDIEKAQRGIIVIDEIDKIRRQGLTRSGQKDVGGESVQQALLKIVEGGVFDVKRDKQATSTFKFDTTNVLFIVLGAFEGIDEIISDRLKKENKTTSNLGFGGRLEEAGKQKLNELLLQVKHEDLQEFGMTPEFMGRFPVLTSLEELSEEALVRVITEPKHSIAEQYTELFKMDDIELELDDALLSFAKEAKKRKIGARALRSVMEEALSKAMYETPSIDDIKKVVVNSDLTCTYILEQDLAKESN